MIKYIKVDWPEYQKFEEHERINECYTCKVYGDDDIYSMMVPEDLYEEILYTKPFPKKYETNLGTIICYKDRAVVNGNQTYWYDESNIKKGDIVLICDDNENWHTSKVVACSKGFPIMLEDSEFIIDINCELIGYYDPEIPF